MDILFNIFSKLWENTEKSDAKIHAKQVKPEGIDEEKMKALAEHYDCDYNFILFDAPAGIDRGMQLAASAADRAIVVSTADKICVRSCARAFDELRRLNIDDTRLVINMFEVKPACKHKLLNIDQCIDETGVQLIGVIPRDINIGFSSVTGKAPDADAPSSLAFNRIAMRITGKRVPLICE